MNLSLVLFGILALVSGALAASNFVLEKFPSAKSYLEKILPYQAIIGITALIISVLKIFDIFTSREGFLANLITLICILSTSIVGFLLGFPMVQQWVATDEKSRQKTAEFRKKLLPWQVIAGMVAIVTGIFVAMAGLLPNR
jgi:hypothetical protein